MAALALQTGQRRYLNQVYLTQQHNFGPINLSADGSPNQDNARYGALDLPADALAWRGGRKRFWIEPTFRDWKSYGFDLEQSQIDDPNRLQAVGHRLDHRLEVAHRRLADPARSHQTVGSGPPE